MPHPDKGALTGERPRYGRKRRLLLGIVAMAWCATVIAVPRLPSLRADAAQVSVSGISSGGYMAVQFHVAYSASVIGAGVVGAGPYYCAQNSFSMAINNCMAPDAGHPLPAVADLIAFTQAAEQAGAVDPTTNLGRAKVWLFSGRKDDTVMQPVMNALQRYYAHYIPPVRVVYLNTVEAGHAFPTLNFGNACPVTGPPFIDKCGIDGAGELLGHIHGPLSARGVAPAANLVEFDQREFFDGADAYSHSARDSGYAYIPAACRSTACRVHVAFHGCLQNVDAVDDSFTRHAGYNEWAETNRLIVLYPQTITRQGFGFRAWRFSFILNPLGCWDWWGYDSDNYYRKDGPQMRAVMRMVQRLAAAP